MADKRIIDLPTAPVDPAAYFPVDGPTPSDQTAKVSIGALATAILAAALLGGDATGALAATVVRKLLGIPLNFAAAGAGKLLAFDRTAATIEAIDPAALGIGGHPFDQTALAPGNVIAVNSGATGYELVTPSSGGAALAAFPDLCLLFDSSVVLSTFGTTKVAQTLRPISANAILTGVHLWAIANTAADVLRVQVIRKSDGAVLVDETFAATGAGTPTLYTHMFASPVTLPKDDTEEYAVCFWNTSWGFYTYLSGGSRLQYLQIVPAAAGAISHLDYAELVASPSGYPNASIGAVSPISVISQVA